MTKAETSTEAPPGRSWGRLATYIVVGLFVAFAAWWLIQSDTLRDSEHSRNTHELDIAAQQIESWPLTVRAMAVGNLLPSRIAATHPAEKAAGWEGAARFLHPRLGTLYIHYGMPGDRTCAAGTPPTRSVGEVGFNSRRPSMNILGSLPIEELWYADKLAFDDSAVVPPMQPADAIAVTSALGLPDPGPEQAICFKAELPLAEMVDLPATAPAFEKLLLIDRSGNLLAQLGGTPLPMASIDEINRLKPLFDSVVEAAQATAAVQTQIKLPPRIERPAGPAVDLSAPIEVRIGGHNYFAYTRSLNLPDTFPASGCKSPQASADARAPTLKLSATSAAGNFSATSTTNGQGETAPTPTPAAASKAKTCLVMGLVASETVNTASLRLSSAVLTGFALLLGLLVALLPVLKLRLIGAGDALRPIEVAAIAMGMVTAVAIGTLTLLFAQAYIRDNERAAGRAAGIASQMAHDFSQEFEQATSSAFVPAPILDPAIGMGAIEPAAPANLECRKPNGEVDAPKATATAPALFVAQSGEGWWPRLESSAMFGEFGMAWPGYVPVLNRCDRGTRANIARRAYFKATIAGGPGNGTFPPERSEPLKSSLKFDGTYHVGAVRAQPDGIEKVIISAGFRPVSKDYRGPQRGALVETFVPRSFVAPVLPAPFRFLVVDADNPALPVLFASNSSRIEFDRFAEDIGSATAMAAIRNARCSTELGECARRAERFSARYEGQRHHFAGHGLAGTPWVLLVHYPADAVARPIAEAAVFAAGAWIGLALVIVLILVIAALRFRERLWRWSWARPGGGADYKFDAAIIIVLAIAAGVATVLLWSWDHPVSAALRLLVVLGTPVAAAAVVLDARSRLGDSSAAHLAPADEAGFRWLAIACLLAVGALPMAALWVDSRRSSEIAVNAEQIDHVDHAIATNVQTRKMMMRAFGTDSPESVTDGNAARTDSFGQYARLNDDLRHPEHVGNAPAAASITGNLRQWSAVEIPATHLDCPAKLPVPADARQKAAVSAKPTMRGDAIRSFCSQAEPAQAAGAPVSSDPGSIDFAWFRWFVFGLLSLGTAAMLLGALGVILRGLFGHGVPLEAVSYPGIGRRDDGTLDLPRKALILNAPLALRLELLRNWKIVDLSAGEAGPVEKVPSVLFGVRQSADAQPGKLIVTGLALALRDAKLRSNALNMLETIVRRIDAAEREPAGDSARLVVMTDLSPLDRILQAYESEQALAGKSLDAEGRREQLRWSRLFEAFATIGFRPASKVSAMEPDDAALRNFGENYREGIATLVNEVRDLPEVVIDSLIKVDEETILDFWRDSTKDTAFPFDPDLYLEFYDDRVRDWAITVKPASRAAAIDYLRGTLIEHYQYAWIASSHAERVILDSLARGRTVNIAAALALRSLVRRGLVRLAPIPRLINESFAAFVMQAEKPVKIEEWRSEQGRSLWRRSSAWLMIVIPAAIIGLVAVALYSGESAIGLMPLLLGSAPAVIGTLGALRRST